MKQKITIGILVIFCMAEIRPLLPFLDYWINYEYITEVLCINKDKPMSTCNGKCYLNQQLKKAGETNKHSEKAPTVSQERIHMIICGPEIFSFNHSDFTSEKQSKYRQLPLKEFVFSPPVPPPRS